MSEPLPVPEGVSQVFTGEVTFGTWLAVCVCHPEHGNFRGVIRVETKL